MRSDECTFTQLMDTMTNDEWQDLYLSTAKRAAGQLTSYNRPGAISEFGQTAGLRFTTTVKNKLKEGGDYAVAAIRYFRQTNTIKAWGDLGNVKAEVGLKAVNLIRDDYRHAKSKGALKADHRNGGGDSWDVHENIYTFPGLGPFKAFLRASGTKQDADALILLERCIKDEEATKFTGERVSFKEKYIAQQEGWTLDEFRHARKTLISRGNEFRDEFRKQQESMPGFVFYDTLRATSFGIAKRDGSNDGD
jgi:hypothetical protein